MVKYLLKLRNPIVFVWIYFSLIIAFSGIVSYTLYKAQLNDLNVLCVSLHEFYQDNNLHNTDSLQSQAKISIAAFCINNGCKCDEMGQIIYSSKLVVRSYMHFIVLVVSCIAGWYGARLFRLVIILPKMSESNGATSEVIVLPIQNERTYCLKKDLCYNASQKIFISNGNIVSLDGKLANLFFEALLQAPDNSLSDESIYKLCWDDNSGNLNKLQSMVSRLRKTLKQVDGDILIERNLNSYQLIIK